MQPERVEKVKSLLAAALSRPPAERDAFLNRVCAGDPGLRREVDSYLRIGGSDDQHSHNAETLPNARISYEAPAAPVTEQMPADIRIGRQFGKYTIRSRVAEGGMGVVYLALDTQLGREVALKVLPEYFSVDAERLARFRREARATSLLNHPNIVTVFEIGQMDGCEFIVTEFVEGTTLRDLMQRGPMPMADMLKITSQAAEALAAAHRAGIIHRDIKPENIMVRPDGYVKVLDFGLAKLLDGAGGPHLSGMNSTTPGRILGTVAYMSPEQAEGLETDARTDIWSLGVILYEMVAGQVPFSGPTASHTIVAILERDPDELVNASPELKRLVATALQKDRALRFQTAEAMASAIDELKHRLGFISDQNVNSYVPAPTAGSVAVTLPGEASVFPVSQVQAAPVSAPHSPKPAPSPYRKLLWLVPAAFILMIIGSVGVYAVIAWMIRPGSDPVSEKPVAIATPTPEPTVEAPVLTQPTPSLDPSPTPSPQAIYVEPTPAPQKKTADEPVVRPPRQAAPKPTPEPVRTPTPEPRRTPAKRQKQSQDPNCVFTNSCKS